MIKLSTRVRYGLRAVIDLASQNSKGPVFLNSIARRQEISRNYLDSLFASLRAAGIIGSVRGASGGYFLTRPPSRISVLDIIAALEGRPILVDCLENEESCDKVPICPARAVWKRVRAAIEGSLAGLTLQDMVDLSENKKMECAAMYYI